MDKEKVGPLGDTHDLKAHAICVVGCGAVRAAQRPTLPSACYIYVLSKKEEFGCLLLWPSERRRPTSLSYIFLAKKTGGDLDLNKCKLHFFTSPPPCFLLRLFCRCFPRFPQGSPRDLQSAHVFLGGGGQNVTLKLAQKQIEATFYAFA